MVLNLKLTGKKLLENWSANMISLRNIVFLIIVVGCNAKQSPINYTSPEIKINLNNIIPKTSTLQEKSIVKIRNKYGNQITQGTGCLIDAAEHVGIVLTAANLFRKLGDIEVITVLEQRLEAELIDIDHNNDIALLSVSITDQYPIIPLGKQLPKLGDKIYTAGYGNNSLRTVVGNISNITINDKRHIINSMIPIRMGDSGSPLWNDQNEVIGVVWGRSDKEMFATGLQKIRELTKSEKVVTYCNKFNNLKLRKDGNGPFYGKRRN